MRYIKSIEADPEGNVSTLCLESRRPGVYVVVHDTSTGWNEKISGMKFSKLSGVIGFGYISIDGIGFAVHDEKTVQLYQYVEYVEHRLSSAEDCIYVLGSDYIVQGEKFSKPFVQKHDKICIVTDSSVIRTGGFKGSIVYWKDDMSGAKRIYSLYDLLGMLCRDCDINLMQYTEILLNSRTGTFIVGIRLKHTKESDRFFTKMLIDVSSKQ